MCGYIDGDDDDGGSGDCVSAGVRRQFFFVLLDRTKMKKTLRGLCGGRSGAPEKQPLTTTMWLKNVLLLSGAVVVKIAPPPFNFEAFFRRW